jgi:hypothetical protein
MDARGNWVRIRQRQVFYLSFKLSDPILGPNFCVYGAIFPGVKRPGRKADLSPPSSAEVENYGSFNFTVALAFMEHSWSNSSGHF